MSLGRSSAAIAAGTLASRLTGLLRTLVLVTALGATGEAADAFAVANQLPNYIFQVISTGVLTAVFVPQIVKWSQAEDGGQRLISKLFTLATVVLLGVTVLSVSIAPLLVDALTDYPSAAQFDLAVAFAYWCLPQVFFYGMFALIGETFNARRMFAPYAWAPITNNAVSIAGFGLFMWLFGSERGGLDGWHDGMILVISLTATLGIAAQTVTLALFWRKTGLRLRPDFGWRGIGFGELRNLAGWSVGMLLVGLGVSIIQQNVITSASGANASSTIWFNSWLVFMLPYSLIVMSIGTPYFTQLSEHAHAGRHDKVRDDIGRSMRILGLFIVIAAAAVVAAAFPVSRVFANNHAEAGAMGPVLTAFIVGLIPMAVLFVIQRTFYAYGDTRTPFFFTLFQATIAVLGALAAPSLFSDESLTAGVALMQSLSSVLQLGAAWLLLQRRIGPFGFLRTLWAYVRYILAAIPAGLAGLAVYFVAGGPDGWMAASKWGGAGGCLVIGIVCLVLYVALLALFRSPELKAASALVRARIGR
ncbi:murein biosynthesis integral membrane protein MurJ [Microbacterium suaedae]|uniref:murein biosynthesis integral membrane protein MurJ n=1 Tax=Microbacterium suaedae TaxID=2067813 RepID=UPI000DA23675|nr:murein biosynthesis integral membrane protein MurJ [Microbacterium suaedae]